jgi:hypothetical protein
MSTSADEPGSGRIQFVTSVPGVAAVAAVTSIGAGAIHAAAVGAHSEHRQAVVAFTAVAVFQIVWGVLAFLHRNRLLLAAGVLGNAAALGGWVIAKADGISFVDGLEAKESIQTADGIAAAFAAIAVLAGVAALWRVSDRWRVEPQRLADLSMAVLIASVVGMLAAGSHSHAEGHDEVAGAAHTHDEPAALVEGAGPVGGAAAEAATDPASAEHAATHAAADAAATDATTGDAEAADAASTTAATTVPAPAQSIAPKPYVPDQPIDLGGVPGVTPQQQARAENLIAITLLRLPQFSDPAYAESQGFRSIGDGGTGTEHYVNRDYLADGRILDPDHPESLVYDTTVEPKQLVSAMFMAEPGTTLETVPDIGGSLTQWHIHDNLCFSESGKVAGLTDAAGNCPPPLTKVTGAPMIHVWIVSHPCGPFAALEGVGAGSIKPGEERLCDHAHGAGH